MAQVIRHIVTDAEQGKRLDTCIAELALDEVASRSAAVRLIESGRVMLNGKPSTKKHIVMCGDTISIELVPRTCTDTFVEPTYSIDLDIRYEDEHIIVLSKQAGLVCHPSRGHYNDTLANALVAHCGLENLAEVQGEDRPGIVHRLDRDTSGLMLAAKTDIAAARLQDAIRMREVDRRYITLVHGSFAHDTGMIDAPIARASADRMRMMVSDAPSARSSVTTFSVLERFAAGQFDDGYSLLECKLYTGRTHQIRVHMAYAHHPVVGDPLYGHAANVKARNKASAAKSELGLERQFLHSYNLEFTHPVNGEVLNFQDDIPRDLQDVLDSLTSRSMGRTEYGNEILNNS